MIFYKMFIYLFTMFYFTNKIQADAILYPLSLVPGMGNPWWMLVQFIPIIILEAFIFKKYLKIAYIQAIKFSFYANLISTIAGIPFGLIINHGGFGNMLGLYPSSYGPTYQILETIIFFISCFILTCVVEYLVMYRMLLQVDSNLLKRVVIKANLVSYLGITLWWIFVLFTDDRLGFIHIGGYKSF